MITIEVIIFIAAILFGIVLYWRESKNNKLYRLMNKLTHSKDLQMAANNPKGFLYMQPFLMRLVWVSLLFLSAVVLVTALTPINLFVVQYFVSAIIGTVIGTYIASLFFVTKKGFTKETLIDAVEKGKDFIEDLAEGKEEQAEPIEAEAETETTKTPETEKAAEPEPEPPAKKSARERLKDKGMIN